MYLRTRGLILLCHNNTQIDLRRFGLDVTQVNILRVVNAVIVKHRMFNGAPNNPDWLSRLYQKPTAIKNVDLIMVCSVEVVIRNPTPVVLHIERCRVCDMYKEERCNASRVRRRYLDRRCFCAGIRL